MQRAKHNTIVRFTAAAFAVCLLVQSLATVPIVRAHESAEESRASVVGSYEDPVSFGASLTPTEIGERLSERVLLHERGTYLSPVYHLGQEAVGVSSVWTPGAEIQVRTGDAADDMGEWILVEENEDDLPDVPGIHELSSIGAVKTFDSARFFQFQASSLLLDAQYFDFSFDLLAPSANPPQARIASDSVGLGPFVISRANWGANEAHMTWDPEYAQVKAIVIHHTAADDSRVVNIDGKEAVRNIYQGHAVTYGWGDVGYNYVIDLSGNIYEGRSGGNGVIGGHTLGYNTGAIGISMVGNYDQRNVEIPQQEALVDLIAYLSYKNRLDPMGITTLKDKTIPVISGHKDLNATSCPGNTLYGRLGDLRHKVADKLATYPQSVLAAKVSVLNTQVDIYSGQKKKVQLSVTNSGNNAFLAYGDKRLEARSTASSGSIVGELVAFGSSLEPGRTRLMDLELTAPDQEGEYVFLGALFSDGTRLSGTDFQVTARVTVPEYAAQIVAQSSPVELEAGSATQMWVDVRNVGKKSWDGTEGIGLIADTVAANWHAPGDWATTNNTGGFDAYPVDPGNIGRITFQIKAPEASGQYNGSFTLQSTRQLQGVAQVLKTSMKVTARAVVNPGTISPPSSSNPVAQLPAGVDPVYSAQLLEQSPYITTSPGLPATLRILFKNTGNVTWTRDTVRLGTTGPQDRESVFFSVGWKSANRIEFQENSVAPGGTATFVMPLKTSQAIGAYTERFRLVAEGRAWFGEPGIFWTIQLKPAFDQFGYVGQSPHMTLTAGQSAQAYLEIENTGSTIWSKSGPTPLRLATASPRDRTSRFLSSNRVAMDKDTVAPGEKVRFTFTVRAPSEPGVYKEYFALVKDGERWLSDIGIFFQWTVTAGTSQPASPSTPPPVSSPTLKKSIQVAAMGGEYVVARANGQEIARGQSGDVVEVGYSAGTYTIQAAGKTFTSSEAIRVVPWSPATYLTLANYEDRPAWNPVLNDNTFKGVVEIRYAPKTKKLWAINELNIEDYLKGVSESIDSFDFEYLKVAAIIQRSYALHHARLGGRHPDDFLTLKNSRNGNGDDQIYQGYNFTQRAANVSRAVDATRGEIVSYQGKPVLTPYFTQSDGRTRAVSEVWNFNQADYPWLISMPDPGSQGLTLLGHGVGLPGRGARDLVKQGKNYKEVLSYFYQGTDTKVTDEINTNVRVGIYAVIY